MASNNKQTAYVRPWHFDCRLSKELPDDKPVRGRFLANLIMAAVAAILATYAALTYYNFRSLHAEIGEWERRMEANRSETNALRGVTTAITNGSRRLDEVASLVGSPYTVSDFVQEIGRTRPPAVRLEMIESGQGALFLRGGLKESSQRASVLLGQYVAELRANPRLAPLFASITLTSLVRNEQLGTINFEVTLKLKADTP